MATRTSPKVTPPAGGTKISIQNGKLQVPDQPIIPFIEGDGTGRDIWRASVRVMDAAVQKAYGGKKKIHWLEIFAGEKSFKAFNSWLPDETVEAEHGTEDNKKFKELFKQAFPKAYAKIRFPETSGIGFKHGREGGERGTGCGAQVRPHPGEGRDRRHRAPAGAHASRRVRRDRHHQPQR